MNDMKRSCLTILSAILLCLSSCSKNSTNSDKEIAVYYGVSSYAMFEAEQQDIDFILNQYRSLTFTQTNQSFSLFTAFYVVIYQEEEILARFFVDENNIFWINDSYYQVQTGSFDYQFLKKLYENSYQKAMKG